MADSHFRIEKQVTEEGTRTEVRRLDQKESVEELARILGGAKITEAVLKNASEMKELADNKKSQTCRLYTSLRSFTDFPRFGSCSRDIPTRKVRMEKR